MSELLVNTVSFIIAIAVVYFISMAAVANTFKHYGGVEKRNLLILSAIMPIVSYLPIALGFNRVIDFTGVVISYVVLFLLSLQIIKSLSASKNYTYKDALVLFLSMFWRFLLIVIVIGAIARLAIRLVYYVAS